MHWNYAKIQLQKLLMLPLFKSDCEGDLYRAEGEDRDVCRQ